MYKCTMYVQYFLKKSKNKTTLKDLYKRNLANVGMAKWRHWLTKYTNKESTFHNIATFHTTILHSSTLVGTISTFTAYYERMVV